MKKYLLCLFVFLIWMTTGVSQTSFNLQNWLNEHTAVKEQIQWETGLNVFTSYDDWSIQRKNELDQMVRKVINQENLGIPDYPELFIQPTPGEIVQNTLSPEDAWQIYLAHIAQSIVVDVYDMVSWKLKDATEQKLKHLFHGSSFCKYKVDHYVLLYEHGCSALGDPLFVFNFLKNNNLIGFDEQNTIGRILDWGRDNLSHMSLNGNIHETFDEAYLRSFDGFQGSIPPIKTIIKGVYDSYDKMVYHWTNGCHGTTGFLKGVCRVVNIEVKDNFDYGNPNVGHSVPIFPGIHSFLSHGDDVYSGSSKTVPRMEISKLFFSLDDFDDFFNPANEGKYVSYSGIKYFFEYQPAGLLMMYCHENLDNVVNAYGLDLFYEGKELDSVKSLLQTTIDVNLSKVNGCYSKESNDYFEKYSAKPFHPINHQAEIISVSLNMPVKEKSIDYENHIISLKIDPHQMPDSLIANFICSDWASIKKISGNEIGVHQLNVYEVTSEDLTDVKIWRLVINDIQTSVNNSPLAFAGADQWANEGATIHLDGSLSHDPDGNMLTYQWTAPTGIKLNSTSIANPAFIAPKTNQDTTYTFSLVVNNGTVDSHADEVVIHIHDFYTKTRLQDSLALVSLYHSTNGSNWKKQKNWLTDSLETWEGVTVENSRVISLNLEDAGLLGTLPSELSTLTGMKSLDLASNQLYGPLPESWSALNNLQTLYLYGNQLSGSLPESWSNLNNLQRLFLQDNQLYGPLPESWSALNNLQMLYLMGNRLTGSLPSSWSALSNAYQIYLAGNSLSGTLPESWSKMSNLMAIYLSDNQLTGQVPQSWSSLTNLVGFGIENNQISALPDLSSLTYLNYLRIDNNLLGFGDIIPNIGVPKMQFTYSPQGKFGKTETYHKKQNEKLKLIAQLEGVDNVYQWYKDDQLLTGKNDSILEFEALSYLDAGTYVCKVTNPHVPDLTLESNPMIVHLNQPPIANAGGEKTVNEGSTVYLDSSMSSDPEGSDLIYHWMAPAGVVLNSTIISKPYFIAPEVNKDTAFTFSLIVNDGTIDSPADQVTIKVKQINKIPIANAGVDRVVNEGDTVSLDGSLSSDPDGDILSYKWTAIKGISLNSSTIVQPSFIAPEVIQDTPYNFLLVVNDGIKNSVAARVVITVLDIVKTDDSTYPFKIYPNPTTGKVNIESTKKQEKITEITVLNLAGSEIYKKRISNLSSFQIELSSQVNGLYMIKITNDGQCYYSKLILRNKP